MAKFGIENTPYSKREYEAFKGKVPRTDSDKYLKGNAVINDDNDNQINVGFAREHFPSLTVTCAGTMERGKNVQFYEDWKLSCGEQILPDGSKCRRVGGTLNEYSNSKISTNPGPLDDCRSGNMARETYACGDNTELAAANGGKKWSGGLYRENGGYERTFAINTLEVTADHGYAGLHLNNSGGATDARGDPKKGHGRSICNGDDWVSTIRQMGNGDTYIQVGKVNGNMANYVMKIDYEGNMTVTTKGRVTFQSEGNHTIIAPKLIIDADIEHTGNMTTSGVHKDHGGTLCHDTPCG